jgi:hypothetical protein
MEKDSENKSRVGGLPSLRDEKRDPVALETLDDPLLIEGLAYWRKLCGARRFPARTDVTPRGLRHLARHTLLMRVIDGGADYEYRVVGDAHVMAHGISVQGMRWSDLYKNIGVHALRRKPFYDRVVKKGEPLAVSGLMLADGGHRGPLHNTALLLPLGADNTAVDHILGISVYAPHIAGVTAG